MKKKEIGRVRGPRSAVEDALPEGTDSHEDAPEREESPLFHRQPLGPDHAPASAHSGREGPAAIVHAQVEFSGPLPHPQTLRQYDEVLPGAVERILRMAEKQQDHRIGMDQSGVRRANWGLGAGYSLSVMGLISSGYLIMHGHDVGGSILGGSTFLSLVTTFVYGSKSRSRENIEKARLLTGQQDEESEE